MTTEMWKLEKDLCRCCHAEGSFKHLSDPCFQLGQEEIYSDMLQDCLDIRIVAMTGVLSDVTYTICDSCVARLRDASNFKRQVQDCEERFKDMYSKNLIKCAGSLSPDYEVKEEPIVLDSDGEMKQEYQSVEDEDDDDAFMKFDDDDSLDLEEQEELITIEIKGQPKGKGKGKAKPKPKPKKETPIKKAKIIKEKPMKMEAEELTEAAVSGEKKKGRRGGHNATKELTPFCKVTISLEGNKTYACSLCVREFQQRKRWTEHFKNTHLKLRKDTHPCVICKQQLFGRHRWKHMEERHGWPAPTCDECGRKFSYPFQVAKHKKEIHMRLENLVHICEQCGVKFSSKTRLYQHSIKHSDVRNFKCEHCSKAFKTVTYLKQHLKTHSLLKEHVCVECGKGFVNYKNLKAHGTKHIVEKNFKCEFCSKGFKTRRHLSIHLKTHTDDKRHVCPVCEKAYVQSNNLKYHIRKNHPEFETK